MVGRYWIMDRDQRWERVAPAYQLLVEGEAEFHADTGTSGLEAAYARDENDEFVLPTVVGQSVKMEDGHAAIFMNFRADRAANSLPPYAMRALQGLVPASRDQLLCDVDTLWRSLCQSGRVRPTKNQQWLWRVLRRLWV